MSSPENTSLKKLCKYFCGVASSDEQCQVKAGEHLCKFEGFCTPFPHSWGLSHFSLGDLLGLLLSHSVPGADGLLTKSLSVWLRQCSLHNIYGLYVSTEKVGHRWHVPAYTHCPWLEVHGFPLCPFLKHWFLSFLHHSDVKAFLTLGCKEYFPGYGFSFQLFAFFLFFFGHRKSQPFPDWILGLGPH